MRLTFGGAIMMGAVTAIASAVVAVLCLWTFAAPYADAKVRDCPSPKIATSAGCQAPRAVERRLRSIVRDSKKETRAKALIVRVDVDNRTLLRRALGASQAGVKARPHMRFRVGSMTVPALTSVAFQLQDEGRLKIGDSIGRWLPELPRARRVTIRMLMNNTSGYRDWIQGNEDFVERLYANPFRFWHENELLRVALGRGFECEPGSCFNYAHTNYLILGRLLEKVTGKSTAANLRQRILRPLQMASTNLSRRAPIPGPALHSYTTERGVFEDATTWSPSWTLGNGVVASASIDDVARLAKGVLSGRTLSRQSRRQLVKRSGPFLGSPRPDVYFAQGLVVNNGWRIQNPYLNGYMGAVAWLPGKRISIAVVATRGAKAPPDADANLGTAALAAIANYLRPGRNLRV